MKTARRQSLGALTVAVAAGLSFLLAGSPASAVTTYGTLDNFDVINDTGGECHGFEIELEGISSADVAYTFGAPYQRYGEPTLVPTATGVIIRYAASYTAGAWSATTPVAVAPYPPTQGHSCWEGGDPNYLASGCDHFGASLNATPTKTTYRWLVEGPTPGSLTAFGSNVPLPAPVWNVTQADPAAQPVAAVAIAPPVPADPSKCGEALWAKVYVTELPNGLHAEDLDHLVVDDPVVDIVPDEPAEIEWEWVLLQACPGNAGEQEFGGGAEVAAGKEAVSRRFEFYKYTGQYDPDPEAISEALCDNPRALDQQLPASERCGAPDANGVAGVGDLIGAQNAAVNLLGPVVVIPENHPPVANQDSASTDEDVALTISPATLLSNDTDTDGDALTITSVQGAINGAVALVAGDVVFTPTPNFSGAASFTYTINDGYYTATATVIVAVGPVNDRPLANAGLSQSVPVNSMVTLNGSGSSDLDGNALTYSWSFTQKPAHSKAAFGAATSPNPTFKADKAGTYVVELVVNDGTMDSLPATVTITATKGKR